MWFRKLRVLALGASLGLAACAPVGPGGLVIGAAPVAPGWSSPGWHGGSNWHGRTWRQDHGWHSRQVGGWGPPTHHRGWHNPGWNHGGWNRGHHGGWNSSGWHGRGGWHGGPRHRW